MGYKNPEERKKKCHEYYLAHRNNKPAYKKGDYEYAK